LQALPQRKKESKEESKPKKQTNKKTKTTTTTTKLPEAIIFIECISAVAHLAKV
jgi:hypothetical protein